MNNGEESIEARWEQIEKAIAEEDEVGDVEGGHEPEAGGTEEAYPEEADEVTAPSEGQAAELGEASVEEGPVEEGPEADLALEEVEGYEEGVEGSCCSEIRVLSVAEKEALEIIHGRDDRVRVWNTKPYPWRTICHLYITAKNGRRGLCTGSLIGPRVVLTAGHCIYQHGNGGWVKQVVVTPGKNAGAQPYGKATGTRFISVKGWTRNRNSNYDYGVIVLPKSQSLGSRVGWMGLANLSLASLLGLRVNNSGYPGDKPWGTQWWNSNRILAVTSRRIYYRIDTYGGQSGSPVWRYAKGKRHIVGVHTTGGSMNGATRLAKPVFKNLVNWKKL